jgi:SAM-dependent methyltransferase
MYLRLFGFRPPLPNAVNIQLHECHICCLRFFVPAFVGDKSLYAILGSLPDYYVSDKAEFQVALEHIPREARILEVGAGTGEFGVRSKGRKYVGLEPNVSGASVARSRGLDVREGSLRSHLDNLGSDRYDAVCAFQMLEHLEHPRDMIEDMLLALEPGGMLILSVPNDESYISLERNSVLNMPPHHQTRWRPQCFLYLTRILPLRLVCIEREILADYHLNSYLNTVIAEITDQLLHRQRREIDWLQASLLMRAFRTLLRFPLRHGLRDPRLRTAGHTMTAVLAKE